MEEAETTRELILPTNLAESEQTLEKLSEKLRNGIDFLVLGLTTKEAAKKANIARSTLYHAWNSEIGREYAALQYTALNTLLRGIGFQAILTIQQELLSDRVDIRLRAADSLLKHLSKLVSGGDKTIEDGATDATQVARQLIQQLNIEIKVNEKVESSAIIDISGEATNATI